MAISIAARKAKGRKLQKWVAEQIASLLNISWGKDKLISSREMGQSGTDVRLIGKAFRNFPWSVECKWQENWSVFQYIRDAIQNEGATKKNWLLFLRKSDMRPVVVLDAELFFDTLSMIEGDIKGISKAPYLPEWKRWAQRTGVSKIKFVNSKEGKK